MDHATALLWVKGAAFLPWVPGKARARIRCEASQHRGEKKAVYEGKGVREYWLLDSRVRTLTLFILDGQRFTQGRTFAEDERCASEVLQGLDFAVTELLP